MAIQGLDQREFTLGGEQFYIQQMPTDKGLELACRLAKLLGGAAQGLGELHAPNGTGKFGGLDVEINIGQIVDGLVSQLDHREVPQLLKDLVRQSMVQPEFSDEWYNIRFSGRYDHLLELVGIILEHNYSSALDVLKKTIRTVWNLTYSPGIPIGESTP